ncbi:MAG: UDP-N-acetylenolpyruvoylglucosamine reductase [uncultured bacterium]|uniref:UDP-N-acetylenolpyruvoylglucosamine reductase n=3 Tax=Candidatus Daviesiibacteriota TaxID=1752718 RepID=A0A0G0ET21_9BACT|nr:MAG: UDP-N-acetylenolpyruvoylglucosamine reductase [uncultured bacterium]KKQ10048.1 MAG: UDP-N-acetylenolpyruvoylglucosamine reductase [Candidatus Daviesbacteria bacterium GW2011_GWB1_36_5]KKQ15934.1 MAG: UDP-N-acetylenolpyruvoylglucosamine reductase [Candidatus Daviesbacteria bacterium GW2011_GWA1_36_8]OGE30781.1 MAG: UDP-N-acetylenolpyruvoylglucosamine reductase [Candidatus Daviesbacteria bacterium RIFCSPHIGHO2_02_FULL_37_9]OGE35170.1 MAG: UDP-N-acetylenolpyruvoylglucosamine reductase [Can
MNKQSNFPLSSITTLGIGGPASQLITITSENELQDILSQLPTTNYQLPLIIGGGSNLLVSDDGYPGTIIKNEIKGIQRNGNNLVVNSGTTLQDLVDFSIKEGLSGLQKLTGIPGTLGGAIYGNAGAYGQTISDHLTKVKTLNPKTPQTNEISLEECKFKYRDSSFKQNKLIILEATFELTPADPGQLQKEADETLEKRLVKYPKGIKCPGSFFKNLVADNLPKKILEKIPEEKIMYGKIPAGALLEEVGAKGDSQGDIEIANYHANLFINKGEGKAKDFYDLAKKYWQKVRDKYGISLEPEVQLINLPPLDQ